MNILGIDYGQKRIGLSWAQTGIDVVLPYGVIAERDPKQNLPRLLRFLKEEKIDKVVIGLPFGLDGEENENTKRIRAFGDVIQREAGVSVQYMDERFTTHEANALGGTVSVDETAAMLILQAYLEEQK
ncbi:MAG TPA: Holliday junction resolvase RuvX [Candidatus Kapabacteria bacterium]|nr:Holliday junction resolvase RuvX [Candidatus Kapabacteria bacterium]